MLTLLFLRGAQTPGELRTRSGRLHEFSDMNEVEQTLNGLITRDDGPMVVRLAREPGKRESRYMHLFGGDVAEAPAASTDEMDSEDLVSRVAQLEQQVAQLQSQLEYLLQKEQ